MSKGLGKAEGKEPAEQSKKGRGEPRVQINCLGDRLDEGRYGTADHAYNAGPAKADAPNFGWEELSDVDVKN